MSLEQVESLLDRSQPAPPPPELRRRILEAAQRRIRPEPPSPRQPRFVEVLTMAASILMLLATLSWLLRAAPAVLSPGGDGQVGGQPFEERRLSDQLPGDSVSDFTWSPDGRHWGCVVPASKGDGTAFCAVIDGKREKEYSEVRSLSFGADGRYAYVASDPVKGCLLIQDGVPHADFDVYHVVSWSPDGKKLAFIGRKGDRIFVVENGRKSEAFLGALELVWSPDSQSLAFSARLDQDWFCVLNGKKGEPFDSVQCLTFAADGKTLAYCANEGEWMVVVGGVKGEEYTQVGPPVFSKNGKKVAHWALGQKVLGQNSSWLVVGANPGPRAAQDSAILFEEIGTPVFSDDGKVWAFRGRDSERLKDRIVISREVNANRKEEVSELFESVDDPVLNPDGSLVAYAAGKGSRKYLHLGGKLGQKFSLIDRISFGPDGKTVAHRAGQYGKQFVVAGESRSDEFDEVVSGPVWSADGKRVAFTARNGSELWSRVLDLK